MQIPPIQLDSSKMKTLSISKCCSIFKNMFNLDENVRIFSVYQNLSGKNKVIHTFCRFITKIGNEICPQIFWCLFMFSCFAGILYYNFLFKST